MTGPAPVARTLAGIVPPLTTPLSLTEDVDEWVFQAEGRCAVEQAGVQWPGCGRQHRRWPRAHDR